MSKYSIPASLFCATALAMSVSAFAQDPVPAVDPVPDPALEANLDAEARFDGLDTDRDGFIEKTDIPPEHSLALEFEAADTNRDARLSRVEFDAHLGEPGDEEESE
ncbi:hypothetical protein [Arenimonas donghaensis]|uniref:EF-hand domain-containing protein n=1 Tax=Arenimonas donghaensis DSM 18148 = HO3-R19 TaxID=1121014 RepID=A0A087MJC6_9GAMM|nr:hypothetical protein [Arenimonas donghaensis]KFL36979.1 hypothetical protein N788_12080 [Arenimonas donghaensis DSM 18148 = HO3-R19]